MHYSGRLKGLKDQTLNHGEIILMTGNSTIYSAQGFFILLHNLHDEFAKLEDREYLKDIGISYQQFLVLITIQSSHPPVNQTVVAKKLRRNLNGISAIINRMVKQGLLIRKRSDVDRRQTMVSLTPQGQAKLENGIKTGNKLKERLASMLSEDDIQESAEILSKVRYLILKELGEENNAEWFDKFVNNIFNLLTQPETTQEHVQPRA
jgi:DNA-binding MarR family transcriptional regulator